MSTELPPIATGLVGTAVDVDDNNNPAFRNRNPLTGEEMHVAKPQNPGTGVIRLDRIHPNMHLTNVYGAAEQLRGGDVAVFSVMDSKTIATLEKIRGAHGERGEHRVNHVYDDPNITPAAFYTTFYRAALQIGASIDGKTTVVHCMAGMNRSCASIVFYCILRAWREGDTEFGSGRHFRLDDLIAYIRETNVVGRYRVLTNKTFVSLLKLARDFELVLHQPQNASVLRLRDGGHLSQVAKTFQWFVNLRRRRTHGSTS